MQPQEPKQQLLASIRQGLADQVITAAEVQALLVPLAPPSSTTSYQSSDPAVQSADKKLNVVDILFYLAGLLLYGALMVSVFQLGDSAAIERIFATLGVGLVFWTLAYVVGTKPYQSDIRQGIVNSSILTGSLATGSGGFIVAQQVASTSQGQGFALALAISSVVLGVFNLAFDRLFRHTVLIIFGLLLVVAAFPITVVALLMNLDLPVDVWSTLAIVTGVFLAIGGRLASRTAPGRQHLAESFESVAGFIVMGSIYIASFGSDIAPFWEILLPVTVYAAFFISIKRRSKNFLVTGSFFLVVFLITIAFKYFSGFGPAFCLILSAASLLGTAFVATGINKRYIKQAG